MISAIVEELAAALGFSDARAWAMAGERGTVYVLAEPDGHAVAVGPATRSPEVAVRTLTRLSAGSSPPSRRRGRTSTS